MSSETDALGTLNIAKQLLSDEGREALRIFDDRFEKATTEEGLYNTSMIREENWVHLMPTSTPEGTPPRIQEIVDVVLQSMSPEEVVNFIMATKSLLAFVQGLAKTGTDSPTVGKY